MKKTVNCSIIGVGRLGAVHTRNLKENVPGVNVKTIVTSNMESAERAAQKFDIPHWTNNPNEVFEDDSIDAVIIAAPTNMHAKLLIDAARYKKHIFVDKPLTETLEQADQVIEEINNNKVICQVGFMRRFDPSYAEAKESVLRGDIGDPLYYKGISRDPGSPPESFIKNSGGIFKDLCIHEYDVARYLIGSEVKSIHTFGKILVHPFMHKYRDADQSMSLIEFENNALADIEASRNSAYGYEARGEIIGTEGMIHIGSIRNSKNVIMTNNKTYVDNITDFPTKFADAFLLEIEHFIDCIQNNQSPSVDEVDGKIALQISEAALKSYNIQEKIYI